MASVLGSSPKILDNDLDIFISFFLFFDRLIFFAFNRVVLNYRKFSVLKGKTFFLLQKMELPENLGKGMSVYPQLNQNVIKLK